MLDKKHIRLGITVFKVWFEVLLAVVFLSMATMYIPGGVFAGESGTQTQPGTEATAVTSAATEAKAAELVLDTAADRSAEPVTSTYGAGVQAERNSEAAYRIKPLQDKLTALNAAEIDAALAAYSDMGFHWSRKVVGKLASLDIIAGANGKFLPNNPVQADQFIKMAVCAMGYKIEQGTGYWAQPYIDTALSEGLVVKGEIADYKKPLTREQMARIIVRTTLKVDAKPDGKYDQYIIGKVTDYHAITDSLKQYVLDGYKLGLIAGTNNRFNPKATLTRAEAAAVIIRFLDMTERIPAKPGAGEIIKLNDSLGVPTEIYPGAIPELFTIAKVAQDAMPKAKGYVDYGIGTDGKYVYATLYKDKVSFEQSIYNFVAVFDIAYNQKDTIYAYTMQVWNDEVYKEYFPDYIREVLKTVFGNDAQKAITLHDKYMNMQYTRTDGLNEYTETRLNNRNTAFIRFDDMSFVIQIKLKGLK